MVDMGLVGLQGSSRAKSPANRVYRLPGGPGGERVPRTAGAQELSSGRPGGLTSEVLTASLERFHAASHFAYWPFSMR